MDQLRYIAPAGTRIRPGDLLAWLGDAVMRKDRTNALRQAICDKFSVRYCFLMSSGRAALAMLFRVLAELSRQPVRNEILLPAYTCYSVPAAAELAGLAVRICEIDPDTLDYDFGALERIDCSRVLAIVSANLYGNPNSLDRLESFAHQRGIYFVDDAAQAMNARVGQRYAGTHGDVGLFSLDKGKNITTLQGGIVVTNNDELARRIAAEIDHYPRPGIGQSLGEAIKLVVYSLLLHPLLYRLPASLPFLGLGKTVYTTDYRFTRYSPHLASMALQLFRRIDRIAATRCRHAQLIREALSSIDGIRFVHSPDMADPVCLRLPIRVSDRATRDRMVDALRHCGIGASGSYPEALSQLDDIAGFRRLDPAEQPGAGTLVADTILTLPTLESMNASDIDRIRRVCAGLAD